MKSFRIALLGLALAGWQPPAAGAESGVITLLHVNDTHSHLEAEGPRTSSLAGKTGGIARAATLIGSVRAEEPNVLLLHAGDALQGDPSFNEYFGVPELEMLAALGVDAFTIGNHEFDFGPDFLVSILGSASAFASTPLLGANVEVPADSNLAPLKERIQPSILKEIAGARIGIFGLTVPGNLTSQPAPVVIHDNVAEIASATIADLKGSGADVIICLSHLGFLGDQALAQSVPGIDVIVGGHDHYLFTRPVVVTNPEGKKTFILQAGSYWQHVGRLRFSVRNGAFRFEDYRMLDVDVEIPPEPLTAAAVSSLRDEMVARWGDLFQTKLGRAIQPLEKTWKKNSMRRDTPLGNLVADAFRRATKSDIAMTTLGLIAEPIAKGPIIGLDVFRAVSYGYDETTGLGFPLATCDITGGALLAALELGVSQAEYFEDLVPQASGLTFKYVSTRPPLQRVVAGSVLVNGEPLDPDQTYSLTVNAGIAYLLGAFGIPIDNVQVLPGTFEYIVLRDEIARRETVNYRSEGRILDLGQRPNGEEDVAKTDDDGSDE